MQNSLENGGRASMLTCAEASGRLAAHLHDPDADRYLWEAVTAFEGCTFRTARGLEFTYQIHRDSRGRATGEIVFNRKEKPVTKATVIRAFQNALIVQSVEGFVSGPKKLRVFGASYLYPVFLRLGVCQSQPIEYDEKIDLRQQIIKELLLDSNNANHPQEEDTMNRSAETAPIRRQRKLRRKITAQEKETAAQKRTADKAKAESMKPAVFVQYLGREADMDTLVESAKAAFHSENQRAPITDLKLYVKPEENAAYYVINETYSGKLGL